MNLLNISVFDNKNQTGVTCDASIFSEYGIDVSNIIISNVLTEKSSFSKIDRNSIEFIGQQIEACLVEEAFDVVKVSYIQDLDFLVEVLSPIFVKYPNAKYVLDISNTNIQFTQETSVLLSQFNILVFNSEMIENLNFDFKSAVNNLEICPIAIYDNLDKKSFVLYKDKMELVYHSKINNSKYLNFETNILTTIISAELAKGAQLRKACKNARRALNLKQN
jgi:hydroxymethylpyrimidine/phosphomethylpyrimidine kinase